MMTYDDSVIFGAGVLHTSRGCKICPCLELQRESVLQTSYMTERSHADSSRSCRRFSTKQRRSWQKQWYPCQRLRVSKLEKDLHAQLWTARITTISSSGKIHPAGNAGFTASSTVDSRTSLPVELPAEQVATKFWRREVKGQACRHDVFHCDVAFDPDNKSLGFKQTLDTHITEKSGTPILEIPEQTR